MKTWVLVWFLVLPPTSDNGNVEWSYVQEDGLTYSQCVEMLAEKDEQFRDEAMSGKIMGHEIYCKDTSE